MNDQSPHMVCSALTIAGSDPSGGAGIQADLATFAATGVFGMAVITALTAQNAGRVTSVLAIDPSMVTGQIATLLEDMRPGAVKTGMVMNGDIIQAIILTLPPDIPLIVDPVMISTSGHRLLDESAIRSVRERLIPRALLVTPNIPEAEILTGLLIHDMSGMEKAGRKILDLGACAVVVKGGHGSGDEALDLLITRKGTIMLRSSRMPYQVHGSGCCLSAAITGYIARGCNTEEACRKGKEIVSRAIEMAVSGISGIRVVNPGCIPDHTKQA